MPATATMSARRARLASGAARSRAIPAATTATTATAVSIVAARVPAATVVATASTTTSRPDVAAGPARQHRAAAQSTNVAAANPAPSLKPSDNAAGTTPIRPATPAAATAIRRTPTASIARRYVKIRPTTPAAMLAKRR